MERELATRAVIARVAPYREADLIVTLLTEDLGTIDALARGARGSRRRFGPALGQLVLARFQLRRPARGELWALERADLEREWTVLAGDLVAFAHASYGLELARELFPTAEPEPEVLAAVTALWDVLVARGPTAGALRTYELALLERLGTGLALDLCAVCGRQDDLTWFDPGRGGALCARCAQGSRGHGVRPLAAATRAYLSRLAGADLAEAGAIDATVDPADRVLAREAMHAVLAAQVGHPLRSVEFLTKLAHR